MKRKDFPTFLDWWAENRTEYSALSAAQDGDPEPLANFIREEGFLATSEARDWVRARLLGLPLPQGGKRTTKQQGMELGIYGQIRELAKDHDCSEAEAKRIYLDQHPDMNDETLKTYVRRAKEFIREVKAHAANNMKS